MMNRLLAGAMVLAFGVATASAQSLDDLNIQIHGYATQGFLYTTQNNILTTNSSDGSPAWTEGVVNLNAQPTPKLRIGAQGRYFLLGNYGNSVTLDWASGDYKANELLGFRIGKVKTPSGLFNEAQDVDPVHLWSLLPQSVYPIGFRTTLLAHYGSVVYGTISPSKQAGKFEYRIFGGLRDVPQGDGILLPSTEAGYSYPSGTSGGIFGLTLHWRTPLRGLMVGASDSLTHQHANVTYTGTTVAPCIDACKATYQVPKFESQYIFTQYEHNKLMFAAEFNHTDNAKQYQFVDGPLVFDRSQLRHSWYGMLTYKITDKLSAGIYDNNQINTHAAPGPSKYQKSWVIAGRYDFNPYLYAKAEEHFIDGTASGYDNATNPGGLKPDTRLTIFKLGVSF